MYPLAHNPAPIPPPHCPSPKRFTARSPLRWLAPLCLLAWISQLPPLRAADPQEERLFGPLYSKVRLTLDEGCREEWLGPLLYHRETDEESVWAVPPLYSQAVNVSLDSTERDLLYPLLTWDRYGDEYRFQIFQFISLAGGRAMSGTNVHRFTLFPFYFQQRSAIPDRNYTALFPIYGTLKNRFFRDESYWVLWPAYIRSRKRDVTTHNVLYPFFHYRHGPDLRGWQFWPLYGVETRTPSTFTNHWDEPEIQAGHRKRFVLWPFFARAQTGLGTTNPVRELTVFPFYYHRRSPQRDVTVFPWPVGYARTVDREEKFRQWSAPWPFIMFARGEGKTAHRVFPLFHYARRPTSTRWHILWPFWTHSRIHSPPLDYRRTRVLFFLYANTEDTNLEAGTTGKRRSLLPFFTWQQSHEGEERLRILSILDPIIPLNKAVKRNYSHLWSLWRSARDEASGRSSHSLLWNLYRHSKDPKSKKYSLLFGLFQYESGTEGRQWRLFYVPWSRPAKPASSEAPPERLATIP